MNTPLKVVIAEPSAIIRSGLQALLRKLDDFRFHFIEIASPDALAEALRLNRPDLLIINPGWTGCFHLREWKEDTGCTDMKCIALIYAATDNQLLKAFDGQFHIYDSPDEIKYKLECWCKKEPITRTKDEEQQTLSAREKEIVVCVVKGMTNREIADSLFLSTHTVVTHRRNIARKLQIHSASGLTIYAIVNKLVELSDIQ